MQSMYLYDLVKFMAGDVNDTRVLCGHSFESHAAMTMLFCLDGDAVLDSKNSKQPPFVT